MFYVYFNKNFANRDQVSIQNVGQKAIAESVFPALQNINLAQVKKHIELCENVPLVD